MSRVGSKTPVCNICGGETFGPGPAGRMASTGEPPCCLACGSLERHRALRNFYINLPIGLLSWRRALQFSPDPAIRPEWFNSFELSVYGGENTIDLQKIERPDDSYDFITLNHVIEFLPDAKAAFAELARVVSGSGILQVGFSHLVDRVVSLDFDQPQGVHAYYHLFGLDFERYFQLERLSMHVIGLQLRDDCTGSYETFHFFSQDKKQLAKLKLYDALNDCVD